MKIKFEIRHYMIIFLSILVLIGMFRYDFLTVLTHVVIGMLSATIVDVAINYLKFKRFILSPSGIITGLIVAEVISFDLPNHNLLVMIASVIAILSKHIIVYNKRHIFNPAAFGIFIISLFFNNITSWWGFSNIWIVLLGGLMILYRLRKYELTLSYLITHTIIILAVGYFSNASIASYIGLTNLYFVSIMLIEPITSPVKKKARITYGALVAIISIISLFTFTTIDHSIIGLLMVNPIGRILDKKL